MDYSFLTRFAATYNCNAYGASTYNNNDACQTATEATAGGTTGSNAGGLAATGTNIAIGIGLGLALIIIGIVLIMKIRRKKAPRS